MLDPVSNSAWWNLANHAKKTAVYFRSLTVFSLALIATGCSIFGGSATGAVDTAFGGCSPTPCVKVAISSLPELPSGLSQAAQAKIDADLRKALYAPLDVDSDNPNRASVMKELSERFEEYKTVIDAPIDWSLERSATVLFSNQSVTAVEVVNRGYLGGAHGFNERSLMTFNSQNGARMAVADVVDQASRSALNKIVEAEFRRARSIRAGQSLQDAGFFILPGQELPLGENFALTDRGLEIQYNPYEIAPYALGETRVRVPREALEMIVKADLRGVFGVTGQQPRAE
jgi:hypothetical protein